jgi:hypothetical protein
MEGYTTPAIKESIANARLIAAAPELLAVLKTTKFALDSVYHITGNDKLLPYIEEAEAAIAKAEGSED